MADLADDLVHGPFIEIVVEVWTIQPLEKLDRQAIRLGIAFLALDHVLDGAEDALAGGKPLLPGYRRAGFGEFLGKHDTAANGAGEAFVGGADVGPGQARRLCWPGYGLGFGLPGEMAHQVDAGIDHVVQDLAILQRILRPLVGGDGLGRLERMENTQAAG